MAPWTIQLGDKQVLAVYTAQQKFEAINTWRYSVKWITNLNLRCFFLPKKEKPWENDNHRCKISNNHKNNANHSGRKGFWGKWLSAEQLCFATCATTYDKTTVNNLKATSTPQNIKICAIESHPPHIRIWACPGGHLKKHRPVFVSLLTASLLGRAACWCTNSQAIIILSPNYHL